MLEIYMTRHGETEWNQVRRMQGQGNSPLTELGREQALWLSERLEGKEINYIYTSPLGRARETADLLNKKVHGEIVEDPRLKEIYLGDWEGLLVEEIKSKNPLEYNQFWHQPEAFEMEGKEDFMQVRERAASFFEELIKKHGSGKVLIVAHAIVLKGLLNYILGLTIEDYWTGKHLLPTSLTKVNVQDNRISLVYLGETSHHKKSMEKGWFIDEE